jgi:hypothetical protein
MAEISAGLYRATKSRLAPTKSAGRANISRIREIFGLRPRTGDVAKFLQLSSQGATGGSAHTFEIGARLGVGWVELQRGLVVGRRLSHPARLCEYIAKGSVGGGFGGREPDSFTQMQQRLVPTIALREDETEQQMRLHSRRIQLQSVAETSFGVVTSSHLCQRAPELQFLFLI